MNIKTWSVLRGMADLAVSKSLENNRSLKMMEKIDNGKPLSNNELKKLKDKRDTPDGKLDRNGNQLKFCRDSESNWIVKNDKPHYGLKEHASVDVGSGFILAATLTPASESDSVYLPYLTVASCHTKEPIVRRSMQIKDILENPIDRSCHPNRWSRHTRNWNPVPLVWLNPENTENAVQMDGLKAAA